MRQLRYIAKTVLTLQGYHKNEIRPTFNQWAGTTKKRHSKFSSPLCWPYCSKSINQTFNKHCVYVEPFMGINTMCGPQLHPLLHSTIIVQQNVHGHVVRSNPTIPTRGSVKDGIYPSYFLLEMNNFVMSYKKILLHGIWNWDTCLVHQKKTCHNPQNVSSI